MASFACHTVTNRKFGSLLPNLYPPHTAGCAFGAATNKEFGNLFPDLLPLTYLKLVLAVLSQ